MHRPLTWSRLAQIAGLTPLAMMATSSTRRFPSARDAVRRPDLSYATGMFDDGPARPNDYSWFTAPADAGQLSLLAIGGRIPQDAPAELVEEERGRLAELERACAQLEVQLERLRALAEAPATGE